MSQNQEPKPIPPPRSILAKGFGFKASLAFWISIALLVLFFTKEGNARQESLFTVLLGAVGVLVVWMLTDILRGKHLRANQN